MLFIAANPNDVEKSKSYQDAYLYAFPFHDMPIESYTICDCRDVEAATQLADYDVVILSGGHMHILNWMVKLLIQVISGFFPDLD